MKKPASSLALRIVLLGALAGTSFAARAIDEAPASYAVMSLIGDSLTIVNYRSTTGSNLDNNEKQAVALADDSFDRNALTVADAAIRRALPGAQISMLLASDQSLYARQEELFESTERAKALLDAISLQLKDTSPRYLVLITKFRSEARLRLVSGSVGSGKLAGLGFYIDRRLRTKRTDTGESGAGFVAPYAYLAVSLIDLKTGAVIRTSPALESTSYSTARSTNAADPWDALTPEQKVRVLNNLLHRAIDRAVPGALSGG